MFYLLFYMKFKVIIVFILLLSIRNSNSENNLANVNEIFHIGKMDSHNKNFVLFFKTREKAILAKGEEFNYITEYPQDLYIYDKKSQKTEPLITYEWFPLHAKFYLSNYDFPVFPEDFAYYLMKDNKTLIMISAVKNINQNFKFDISTKKLHKYSTKGKLDFIVLSITKNCGFTSMEDTYQCNYYKPLISKNLIN